MSKNTKADLKLNAPGIKKTALLVRAVNHPVRQKMLKTIAREENICVSALYRKLHLAQAEVSRHLAVLRRAGVVSATREGKKIHYRVHHHVLEQLSQAVNRFLKTT